MDESLSSDRCALCGRRFEEYTAAFASRFDQLVCRRCDGQAITEDGKKPEYGNEYEGKETVIEESEVSVKIRMPPDDGDNPVYIDSEKCWRWYRFGGFVTLQDGYDCDSLEESLEKREE